ncbi:diguanylate cyclase [Pseudoalteromonas sp. T1lg65]|uniref:GGDEF domain-containing protein n=1 Tax=Pseudoalteromonas sp. T1lg65 TaxID=2077101 RepID=UPI003F7AD345
MAQQHPYSKPDNSEAAKFALLRKVAVYCLWIHAGLILVFWQLGVPFLSAVNIGSVLLWYAGIRLIDQGAYSLALRIFCFEVAAHAILVCAILGMGLGFQYYLWTVSCLMLLDYQLKLTRAVSYAIGLISLFALLQIWFADIPYRYAYPQLLPYVHTINVLACGVPMIYTIAQIRELTLQQKNTLATLAAHDPLTHLFNRRYANELILHARESCLSTGCPICVLMADIDHFKDINDELGHDTGDAVLVHVAEVIQQHLKPADIAVRWGGEEFLFVLAPCNIDEATTRAEALRKAVGMIHFDKWQLNLTISLGVTQWQASQSFEEAVQVADTALYDSKNSGRNKVTTAMGGAIYASQIS